MFPVVWPVIPPGPGAVKGLKPHLVVQLKPGWRYQARRRRFVSAEGGVVEPRPDLPKGSRIVYQVPALALGGLLAWRYRRRAGVSA